MKITNRFQETSAILIQPFYLKYIIRCLLGTAICYALYFFFPQHLFNWSIVSVVLVLAPDENDSIKLAMDRMKANIIGSIIGLIGITIGGVEIVILLLGVLLTIGICTLINIGAAQRTALAALVIVLIQEDQFNKGNSATERMFCVIVGCLVAIGLTFMFSKGNKIKGV